MLKKEYNHYISVESIIHKYTFVSKGNLTLKKRMKPENFQTGA